MKKRRTKIIVLMVRLLFVVGIIGILYIVFDDYILLDRIESNDDIPKSDNFVVLDDASEEGLYRISDFQNKYQKSVILFTSTWCGSCEYLASILADRATWYPNIQFYQIDIDSNRTLAENMDVYITPSLVMIDEINAAYESGIERNDIMDDLHFFSIVGVSNLPITYEKIEREKY